MSTEGQELEQQDLAGLTVKVTFDLPFCLYLDDGLYEVSRGGWTAAISLGRVEQTHLDPRLGIAQSTAELARDRYGRLRYTRLTVELPGRVVIEKELRRQAEEGELDAPNGVVSVNLTIDDLTSYTQVAFLEAFDAANRLIEVYRHVTDAFYIRRVPVEDIFQADINWHDNGELLGGAHYGAFGHGMTLAPTSVTPQVLDTLLAGLKSDDEIPIPFELIQDSRDRLDRGEYRLAVIDARSALEVYVDGVLLGYFEAFEMSTEQGCQILHVSLERVETLEDAVRQAAINRKIGHALNVALSIDIHDGNPQLWERWLSAKELRERAAHRGQQVERSQAIEAVNSMGEIMDHIRHALHNAAWL